MQAVLLTALGVGGATVIGALLGFLFKNPSHKLLHNSCVIQISQLLAPVIKRDELRIKITQNEYEQGLCLTRALYHCLRVTSMRSS
jgi:PII-like signaling protein